MEKIEEIVLEANEFKAFNEVQEKALKKEWKEKSLVVSAPTASGKTIVAELLALNSIIGKRRKAVYTCPLRALASEHFKDWKRKYSEKHKIRMALSTGDFDSSSNYLQNYDLIFTTFEKLQSLLRHKAEWLQSIGLLIVDEIHEIDSDRGPTIEVSIAELLQLNPKIQILGLSATIPNSKQLAKWLNAELVESDYRPVKLKEGVHFNEELHFGKEVEEVKGSEPVEAIIRQTLHEKEKQALVFCSTRKSAEASAKKLAKTVENRLSEKEKEFLSKKSLEILHALEQPTEQCRTLAELARQGVAFHHAGLLSKQRELIEELFKSNHLKVLTATPTLCIAGDSKIWAGMKETRANEFKNNGKLWVLSENSVVQGKASGFFKNFNSDGLIRIKTSNGYSIRTTPNHKFLVKRQKKTIEIPAAEIKETDKLATVGKIQLNSFENCRFKDFCKQTIAPFDFQLDEDWFYLIGAMLGDGYSGAEYVEGKILYKTNPSIVGNDSEIFLNIVRPLRLAGLNVRIGENSYKIPQMALPKNKWFREFLLNCGIDKGRKKHITEKLMNAAPDRISAILQGLFDTDGFVTRNKGVGFSNTSELLILDVRKLLLRFGIISRVRKKNNKVRIINSRPVKGGDYYELEIANKKSIMEFNEKIGFRVERKQRALQDMYKDLLENTHFCLCPKCNFKIYFDLFGGRTKKQKEWGLQKIEIMKYIGINKKATSKEITKTLGFIAFKSEKKLNHHFELLKRTKKGNSKVWELNKIGKFVFENFLSKNRQFTEFFATKDCPICKNRLEFKTKNGWREQDFEGDMFWDFVKKIEEIKNSEENTVFDVSLPEDTSHFFVSDGIIVHNSAGVNLPAFRVVITSVYRYSGEEGSVKIPVREYRQMSGRAGRPKYDSFGESVIIARTESEMEFLKDYYINGEMEDIESKLGIEPILRMHTLAAIASGFVFDLQSLEEFYKRTFYALQYGNLKELFLKLQGILEELENLGFILTTEEEMRATKLGKRVSELYLDPLSAYKMIQALGRKELSNTGLLFMLCDSFEFSPLPAVPKARQELLMEEMEERKAQLPVNVDIAMFEDPELLKKFNSVTMLEAWLSEKPEILLMKEFNVQPGILHAKLERLDWLSYAAFELAQLLELKHHLMPLSKLRKRVKYGIKEELIALVELKGIGRVRARKLFNAGLKTVSSVKNADLRDLEIILGSSVAKSLKEHFGEKTLKAKPNAEELEQAKIDEF